MRGTLGIQGGRWSLSDAGPVRPEWRPVMGPVGPVLGLGHRSMVWLDQSWDRSSLFSSFFSSTHVSCQT
jgi:hypothetical protein